MMNNKDGIRKRAKKRPESQNFDEYHPMEMGPDTHQRELENHEPKDILCVLKERRDLWNRKDKEQFGINN